MKALRHPIQLKTNSFSCFLFFRVEQKVFTISAGLYKYQQVYTRFQRLWRSVLVNRSHFEEHCSWSHHLNKLLLAIITLCLLHPPDRPVKWEYRNRGGFTLLSLSGLRRPFWAVHKNRCCSWFSVLLEYCALRGSRLSLPLHISPYSGRQGENRLLSVSVYKN